MLLTMNVNSGTILFLPIIIVFAMILAVSKHLDARLYLTTDGLMSRDNILLHASSTCAIPIGVSASSRLVINNGFVLSRTEIIMSGNNKL